MPHTPALPQNLPDWLNHLERLHPVAIDMGLDRVRQVAQKMPDGLAMPCPVITVAGTNGKGSTCAMLEAILSQSGYRTALYTSPHLVDFEERCRLNGDLATAEQLCAAFEVVAHACEAAGEVSLTYFEFTTLGILRLMQIARPDVVILEVGLGGRLDATTCNPDRSVIGPASPRAAWPAPLRNVPVASIRKSPARVYASVPSGASTANQPAPRIATSSGLPVVPMAPWASLYRVLATWA